MADRKIRIGMVGGGKDAFIGEVHRIALRLDGNYELVAGSFSSNFDNSKETGKKLGLAEDRVYETYQEMAKKECDRSDGIEVVAIVTPNHLHVPIAKIFAEKGIHIICDKPLALSSEEAIDLKQLVKSKKIIFSNNSSNKLFQIKLNENISGFLRNPDLLNSIDKAFKGTNVTDLEIEVRNQATQRLNITAYLDHNNIFFDEQSCVLLIRDLTEFHKFQQLKSDFVANVSHELRTPLQSIKMGLETFDNNRELKNNSEMTDLLPVMISQSERMENLIRDLLSLSKIELQEHIRPTHEIDLIELLDYIIKTYEKIISKNNIQIKFNKIENFKIIGDRDKLIEIFTNLIDNSIKYSDKNK